MDLREKVRTDWTRRALADAPWWAFHTPELDGAAREVETERDLDWIVRGLDLSREAAVLEVGCGVGRLVGRLADQHVAVVGVDISPAMLEAARVLHPERPTLRYVQTDGVRLPFPARSFDLVYSWAVFHHTSPAMLRASLVQIRRVLAPTGALRLQVFLGELADPPPDHDTLRVRAWSRAELDAWFGQAGLRIVDVADLPEPEPADGMRPVLLTARPDGTPLPPPRLPAVPDRSSAAEVAQEWALLLHLVQNASSGGALRRALHIIRAGNRLLPAQAVGWWVEARLLAASGQRDEALLALDHLDRMTPNDADAEVRAVAAQLRAELEGEGAAGGGPEDEDPREA